MDSIIPFGPVMDYVDEKPLDPIELIIYVENRAAFTLRDDNEIISFSAHRTNSGIELSISESNRTYYVHFGSIQYPVSVTANDQLLSEFASKEELEQAPEGWYYDKISEAIVKVKAKGKVRITLQID